MRKKQKSRKFIAVVTILLILISIGYAALSTNLSILGNATIKAKNWNIYFNNVQVKEGSISGAKVTTAPTTSGTSTTTLNWTVSMDTPGEFYEFNVDVVNSGDMDAMISTATNSIITSTLTQAQQEYLEYTITYVNGAAVEQYDKLAAGETKTLTIKLLFKEDVDPADLPSTAQNGISLSYSANYVQADNNAVTKVTEIANLGIGDTVNYSTTLNGQTLSNWKVFYVEGDYTYIIYGDYLPNAAVSNNIKSTYGLIAAETYQVYGESQHIVNASATKSNWDDLLTGTIDGHTVNESRSENVWAMGSPTAELWVNSWNASYPSDTLYTRYAEVGNVIGETEDTTSTDVWLNEKTGYGNTLYFPHPSEEGIEYCYGYWLATISNLSDYDGMCVDDTQGMVGMYYDYSFSGAFRPVIRLPSSVLNQ